MLPIQENLPVSKAVEPGEVYCSVRIAALVEAMTVPSRGACAAM